MSELGYAIAMLVHTHRHGLTAYEMTSILMELNDIATKRGRKGLPDLNDAMLSWANDNFQCEEAGKEGHGNGKLEWA